MCMLLLLFSIFWTEISWEKNPLQPKQHCEIPQSESRKGRVYENRLEADFLYQDTSNLKVQISELKERETQTYSAIGVNIQSSFKEVSYIILQILQHCIPLPFHHLDSSFCELYCRFAVPHKRKKNYQQIQSSTQKINRKKTEPPCRIMIITF